MSWSYGDPVRDLVTAEHVDEISDKELLDVASASYGLGNNFRIDWDVFYNILESQLGWCLDEWDSPADRKIRRKVSKWVRDGDVS